MLAGRSPTYFLRRSGAEELADAGLVGAVVVVVGRFGTDGFQERPL